MYSFLYPSLTKKIETEYSLLSTHCFPFTPFSHPQIQIYMNVYVCVIFFSKCKLKEKIHEFQSYNLCVLK